MFTADDAIQSYTLNSVNQFLAQRKNPNGCRPAMTYYTSLSYTNYTLVTDWYVAGNEIADHTYVPSPVFLSLGFRANGAGCNWNITFRNRPHPRNPDHVFGPLTHGFVIF